MTLLADLKAQLKEEQQTQTSYHHALVQLMLGVGAAVLFVFAMVHVVLGFYGMAVVQMLLSIVYTLAYFDFFKVANDKFKEVAIMVGTSLLFWFFLVDGGIANTAIYWVPLFPFLAFAVAGVRRGLRWVILFLLGVLAIEAMVYAGLFGGAYSMEEKLYFFSAFAFYMVVAMFFEVLHRKQHIDLQTQNASLQRVHDTLNEALLTLEEEVQKRTFELKQINQQLEKEVERHKKTNKELRNAEQQFYQAQKMDALGTLVSGVAHDFSSLLSGIHANLFLVQRHIKDKPQVQSALDDIEKMVFHASNMTKQLLTYARKDEVEKTQCNLSLFMRDALKLVKTSLPARIQVDLDVTSTPLPVLINTTQIQQVLMNIVNNARDALSSQDAPIVRIVVAPLSAAQALRRRHPVDGERWAYISIQDNGSGIGKKHLPHVFDPFFTTKKTGQGSGLGLAMSYGAIQSHGGVIEVDSLPHQGTTFHIYLPLVNKKQPQYLHTEVDTSLQSQGETVLLVDDDETLQQAQQSVLQSLGYEVKLASNGFEAIKAYAEGDIDIVIMDIMMPEMGGIKAAQHITSMNHHAKIIFVSAYDKDSSTERFLSTDFEGVDRIKRLTKPFTIQQLCQAIRSELD